ncbi:MAG: hypothetical protein WKF92_15415 [Pyrinomonadaceae bacterium]
MIAKVEYLGFPNCVEISNGDAKLIVSTDFGPRILLYALDAGENILGWHGGAEVKTGLGTWKPYGGHRLWIAPENMPLSYAPDNEAVEYSADGEFSARFIQPLEPNTKTQKEITVTLSENSSEALIDHKITNHSDREIELSAWALTIMRPGGEAVIPNEPAKAYSGENLLPVRSMAVWPYTDFTDPRWKFEKDSIRLRVDENENSPQKVGVLNKQGWAAYEWEDLRFIKRFDFVEGAVYPDMNSNTEVYTAGSFVEVETLSPMRKLQPEKFIAYSEKWQLNKVAEQNNEISV